MGDRSLSFAAIPGGIASVHAILGKVGLDGLLIANQLTFRNRQVGPAGAVFFELLLQIDASKFPTWRRPADRKPPGRGGER